MTTSRWLAGLTLMFAAQVMAAQGGSPVVGAWQRITRTDAQGAPVTPEPAYLFLSATGQFAQMILPAGRPKLDKPVAQMTKEELLARFDGVTARYGTYTVVGNRLVRKNVSHSNPGAEGAGDDQLFRIEGDVMTLTNEKDKSEVRFRRLGPKS